MKSLLVPKRLKRVTLTAMNFAKVIMSDWTLQRQNGPSSAEILPALTNHDRFSRITVLTFKPAGGEGGLPRVSPFGGDTINHNTTDLWWIPFFFHFVWSQFSFRPKTHWFCGEDFFLYFFNLFFWSSSTSGPKTHSFCREDLFFHQFLDQKRVPPRTPSPGATILSNATGSSHTVILRKKNLRAGTRRRVYWKNGQKIIASKLNRYKGLLKASQKVWIQHTSTKNGIVVE